MSYEDPAAAVVAVDGRSRKEIVFRGTAMLGICTGFGCANCSVGESLQHRAACFGLLGGVLRRGLFGVAIGQDLRNASGVLRSVTLGVRIAFVEAASAFCGSLTRPATVVT